MFCALQQFFSRKEEMVVLFDVPRRTSLMHNFRKGNKFGVTQPENMWRNSIANGPMRNGRNLLTSTSKSHLQPHNFKNCGVASNNGRQGPHLIFRPREGMCIADDTTFTSLLSLRNQFALSLCLLQKKKKVTNGYQPLGRKVIGRLMSSAGRLPDPSVISTSCSQHGDEQTHHPHPRRVGTNRCIHSCK